MSDTLLVELGIPLATFVLCLLSAVVPLIHAELFLITVSALSSPAELPVLAVLAALGQILGKTAIYFGGRGVLRLSSRVERLTERYRERIARGRRGDASLVLLSSFTGFPPFLVTSALAGMLAIRFRTFFLLGFAGRLGRFAIALGFPQLVRDLVG